MLANAFSGFKLDPRFSFIKKKPDIKPKIPVFPANGLKPVNPANGNKPDNKEAGGKPTAPGD